MYDSSYPDAREESGNYLTLSSGTAGVAPVAPSARFHLMRIRTTMRPTQENTINKHLWSHLQPHARKTSECILFAYLLNRAVAEKQVTSVCSLFFFFA